MLRHEKGDYNNLIFDIENNNKFLELKKDLHHGTSKYNHCERVSYLSYRISKFFGLDYRAAARAGLLHDFFYGERNEAENSYLNHPILSAKNAKQVFNVSKKEEEMIRTHMFPYALVTTVPRIINKQDKITLKETTPKSKEGWIICLSDVLVSAGEWSRYRVSFSLSILILFMINMLTLNK